MATVTQTTSVVNAPISGGTQTYLMKEYYAKKTLERAKTVLVHANFGQKKSIPKGSGKTVEFRRWNIWDPSAASTPLTEGVTPDGLALSQTAVKATVDQYGAFVQVSDMLDLVAIDPVIRDSSEMLGELLGTVIEHVTRDAMNAGGTVQYAKPEGGAAPTARNGVAATCLLTVDEIRRAVRTLKKNKARKFTRGGGKGHFICICNPDATYDLQNDTMWQDVSKYSDKEQIYDGELGKLFGVVFVESTEGKVFEGAGASGIDVHSTLVFGADAYGVIDVGGKGNVQSIIKPHGSAGAADPLDQRATVGSKVMAYTAKILNDAWIVRIEHAVSA